MAKSKAGPSATERDSQSRHNSFSDARGRRYSIWTSHRPRPPLDTSTVLAERQWKPLIEGMPSVPGIRFHVPPRSLEKNRPLFIVPRITISAFSGKKLMAETNGQKNAGAGRV